MKNYNILFLLSIVAARLVLHYSTPHLNNKICFSSGTPELHITNYWMEAMEKFPVDNKKCELGDGVFSSVTLDDMPPFIKAMTTSDEALRFTCIGSNDSYIAELTTDGDVIPGESHSIIDCKTGETEVVLSPVNVAPAGLKVQDLVDHDREVDAVLLQRDQLIEELRTRLRDSKIREESAKEKSKQLTEELDTMKKDIDKFKGRTDELILHLESERLESRISRNKSRWLEHELKDAKEDVIRLQNDMLREPKKKSSSERTTKASLKTVLLYTTTMIPLLLGQTDATKALGKTRAKCSHARNRIGSGKNSITGITSPTCSSIDYELRCDSLEILMMDDIYPFASSHIHKQTILEAVNDGFIEQVNDGVCQLDNDRPPKCFENRSKMRPHCPNGFRASHYLDDEGKLRGLYCKEDSEVTEDCLNCRKLKSKPQKQGSIQMQDAMCQNVTVPYKGPLPAPRGYCKVGLKKYKSCKTSHTEVRHVPFMILKGSGKVYLDSLILKNNEESDISSFLCYKNKGQYNTGDGVEARVYKSVKITECSNVDSSKTTKCTGDHVFCSKFKCEETYPEVQCIVAPGAGPVMVRYAGGWVLPVCFGYENTIVELDIQTGSQLTEEECDSCVYSCDPDGVRIRTTGFKVDAVIACASGHCSTYSQKPSTNVFFQYPGMSYGDGSTIGVHLSHDDDTISSHMIVQCEAKDPCMINTCIICTHTLINYQCHTFLSAFVCTLLLLSIALIMLLIIKRTTKTVKSLPRMMTAPIHWLRLLIKWVSNRVRQCFRRQVENINAEIGWRGPPQRVVPIPRYTGFMAIILFLIVVVDGCSETVISDSKITKCSSVGSVTTCILTGSVVLQAGTIGTESCLIVKTPSGQKSHMSIKTVSSELVCREGDSYWTSNYVPKCLSSRRCYWVGECHSTNCQAWSNDMVSSEFLKFGNETKLSENRCFEQCGGISCGCFNMNPSCLFVHSNLESISRKALRAFSCSDWSHRVTFEITDIKGLKEKFTLFDTGSKFFSWGSVSLGLDAESITGSNSFSFLHDPSSGFALIDEEFSTTPRSGFVGEVRCSSELAAVSAHKSCKWAPDLIKYRPVTDYVECSSNLIDPFVLFKRGFLPQSRNGKMYTQSIDKKSVQAVSALSIRATLRLLMEGLEVHFEERVANCKAAMRNITGCYSCNEGAKICLSISTDQNSSLYAESSSGIHIAFPVSTGVSDYCSIVHFNDPSVEEILKYSCGGTDKELHISGTLLSVEPHNDRNKQSSGSVVVNPREVSWNFFSWVSGLIKFLGGPLKTAMIVIGLIILSCIVIAIIIFAARSGLLSGLFSKAKAL
ncbi:glycoprotein [Aguacate virus]|uniref:Envelopment polyprotein n=1 Tax=Aguacate virus TaxID=1006583 RepID=F4ZCK0_9VIRU|nr:glycoprotein [Aguacate virus]AEB70968.1 glycoprotein [Aguacate virus]